MKNEYSKNPIKIWIHLYKYEIKRVFTFLLPVFLLLLILQKGPLLTRKYLVAKLDSEVIGVIDNVEKRTGSHESEVGSSIIIKSYIVKYHYLIDDQRVDRNEIIDRSTITLKQTFRLRKIVTGDSISVKYDSENIKNSRLNLE